jgi:ubiquinone/menaquinone biosynthesis C-methylase UbiE
MAEAQARFVPAAGRRALTGLYDPVSRLTMREGAWRPALVARAATGRPDGVLDLGCGTGALSVPLAEAGLRVIGVDGDPDVLARARARAQAAGVELELREGLADALPLPDGHVDRVVCSLVLHHLDPPAKARALAEARRVLRPRGRLLVADWGRPADPLMRLAFLALQTLDGFANTRDHVAGRLPGAIAAAGFSSVRTVDRLRTAWGSLELLEAAR